MNDQVVAPGRDVRLELAQYQPPNPLPSWSLLMAWTGLTAAGGDTAALRLQLYQDANLDRPLGAGVPPRGDGTGSWNPLEAGVTMDPGTLYWIALADGRPVSNGLPVLWQPLTLAWLACDGVKLDFGWRPPTAPFNDYRVALTSPAGEPMLAVRIGSVGYPTEAAGVQAFRVDLEGTPLGAFAGRLPFSLRQAFVTDVGMALGPPVDAQAYVDPPIVVSASSTGGDRTVGLGYSVAVRFPGDLTPEPGPVVAVTVTCDGRPYGSAVRTPTTSGPDGTRLVAVQIPPVPGPGGVVVPAGGAFAVQVARTEGLAPGPVSTGPDSPPLGLPTGAPLVTAAGYTMPAEGSGEAETEQAEQGRLVVTLGQALDSTALVTVTDDTGRAVGQNTVVGPYGVVPFTAAADRTYKVAPAALTGQVLGPTGTGVPLLTSAPVLTAVRFDGAVVSATWTGLSQSTESADEDATGYYLQVRAGGRTIAGASTGGTSAAVTVAAAAQIQGVPLTVDVAAVSVDAGASGAGSTSVGSVVEGPACAPLALVTAAPTTATAATDPVSGKTTVSWAEVPGATGYEVRLYRAGELAEAPIIVERAQWEPAETLEPGSELSLTIAAVRSDDSVAVTGPASAPLALPTGQPVPVSAGYDGVEASVAWAPAPAPGSALGTTGSVISILVGDEVVAQAEADATATSATLALPGLVGAAGATAVVQARTDAGTGPASAPVALLAPALFPSTAPAAQQLPHVFPATDPAEQRADITVYLPPLGSAALKDLPITKGPFTLAVTQGTAYPYKLTIAADGDTWNFSPDGLARKNLRGAYQDLIIAAEEAGAVPAGITTLQNSIARALPQTFAETLFYSCGFDPDGGSVFLRAGTVLRVSFADYLYTGQAQAPAWINGYSGGSFADLEVGSYIDEQNLWKLGFDAFVAQMVKAGSLLVNAPPTSGRTQAGAAAAADLFFLGLREPYLRLFVPSPLEPAGGTGSNQPAANFSIAAASSYSQLVNKTLPYPTASNFVAYFRGRAIVTPCARITVDGAAAVVPLGTTVGDLLDRYGRRPAGAAVRVSGIRLDRPSAPAAFGTAEQAPSPRAVAAAARPVRFDWGEFPVYGRGLDAFALPVLPGDRIEFGS